MKHRSPRHVAERLKARVAAHDSYPAANREHVHHKPGSQNPHKGDGRARSKRH